MMLEVAERVFPRRGAREETGNTGQFNMGAGDVWVLFRDLNIFYIYGFIMGGRNVGAVNNLWKSILCFYYAGPRA